MMGILTIVGIVILAIVFCAVMVVIRLFALAITGQTEEDVERFYAEHPEYRNRFDYWNSGGMF